MCGSRSAECLDTIAIRIDGPKAAGTPLSVLWHFTDTGKSYSMELSNGVLSHSVTTKSPPVELTLTLTRAQLLGIFASGSIDGIDTTGDPSVLMTLMSVTDRPDPAFAVVTP